MTHIWGDILHRFAGNFENDPQNCFVQVFLSVSHAGTCHLSISFNALLCCFRRHLPAEELVMMISIK
jgi:hypothetical protein